MSMFLKTNHNAVIASWKEDEKMRSLCGKLQLVARFGMSLTFMKADWLMYTFQNEEDCTLRIFRAVLWKPSSCIVFLFANIGKTASYYERSLGWRCVYLLWTL